MTVNYYSNKIGRNLLTTNVLQFVCDCILLILGAFEVQLL